MAPKSHRLSVAPMMDRTDRFFRFFLRQISRHALLYTEMVTHDAVIHGRRDQLLGFDAQEHPIALQLGGCDPARLAEAAAIAQAWGYDEVNLNVGCPSDRVQARKFGACLMKEPELVAECVAAMAGRVSIPVTVKHRIGVDDLDRYEDMLAFVDTVAAAGCDTFIVHARKAWLSGLSPKENRDIPPLRYGEVHRLKAERPGLTVELNGGIRSLDEVAAQLPYVDGVMVGRACVDDPFFFAEADRRIFGDEAAPIPTRWEVAEAMIPFIEARLEEGHPLGRIVRHTHSLFRGGPGSRPWKQHLAQQAFKAGAGVEVWTAGLERVKAAQRDARPAAQGPEGAAHAGAEPPPL